MSEKKIRTVLKSGNSLVVTLPKEVRQNLDLKLGDNIVFFIDGEFVKLEKLEI